MFLLTGSFVLDIMNLIKMQIPQCWVLSCLLYCISLATIGVCVFCASASVGAFFIISKQCELIEKAHFNNVEVLLSCHPGIPMNCQQVVDLALFMEKRNPDIIKIVTAATNDDELFESIRTIRVLKKELKIPVSFHTNGSCGALSRVVNPALGGHIAFCVDRFNEGSTMEQLDLKTAKIIIDNLKKVL